MTPREYVSRLLALDMPIPVDVHMRYNHSAHAQYRPRKAPRIVSYEAFTPRPIATAAFVITSTNPQGRSD